MTILCIETSTSCCSAAICKDGVALVSKENLNGANHASELPVFIEELLLQASENAWTIDAVALSEGPGSYTGLRIGTSIAKGICYGMNIPFIPLDTLQILSVSVKDSISDKVILCPMLDARRMEVYTAMYDSDDLHRLGDVEAKVIDEMAFADMLEKNKILFFGSGADKCKSVITSPRAHFLDGVVPHAKYMGGLAEQCVYNALDTKQMAYYEPFYLKDFVPAPSHVKGLK
jgi:tRNA threonylcarbamoyladenosine biosynthesis protein TsaB